MKNIKVIFGLAFFALFSAALCLILFLFAPEKAESEELCVEQETTKTLVLSDDELTKVAEEEILRFRESYGVDIDIKDMKKQLKIREDYEQKYGQSYELEEVFLSEMTKDDSIGDPGLDEYEEIVGKIQEYIKRYNIDESRYASMTAKEELEALEIEYGPLDGYSIETDSNVSGEITTDSGGDANEQDEN